MNVAKFEEGVKESKKLVNTEEKKVEEKIVLPTVEQKEADAIIDKYIMGDPIEKKFSIRDKIPFTLRDPGSDLLKISEHSLYADNKDMITMELPRIINEGLLACWVTEFNGHNFLEKQGDNFNTKESYRERKAYLLKNMNQYIKDFVLRKIADFQILLKVVFSEESLKNF